MHISALHYGKLFFDTYLRSHLSSSLIIVDVGAQDVNGSLRQLAPQNCQYVGVDFVPGAGVDIILDDPYKLPFETGSVDAVVCSSVYEHSEFFWLLFLESLRILKPNGLLYLNAPSNGALHRYPIDAWRFYPDAGKSLTNWARHNGMNAVLLESFIGAKRGDLTSDGMWNDFVAVIARDENHLPKNTQRIIDNEFDIHSAYALGSDLPVAQIEFMPDLLLMGEQINDLKQAWSREESMSQLIQAEKSEKESLRQAVQTVQAEKELLSKNNQALNAKKEKLLNELYIMRKSRSWRYTKWIRHILNVIRRNI